MFTKDFQAAVKAVGKADGLEDGQFEAIVSVFGNEDSYGDVVMPGAFKGDLERWAAKGDPLPVIWSHDWTNPDSHLGWVVKAEERPEGLWVRAQMDPDDLADTTSRTAKVYRMLKGRRVTQFSFAYDVLKGGFETINGRDVYALHELKLHEVGPCLLGVNQETELLAVKAQRLADGAKAGRVLSQKNYDALVAARDAIGVVIDAAQPEEPKSEPSPTTPESPDAGQTEEPSQADAPEAKDEEPKTAKSEEPTPVSAPRRALAVATITTL